MKHWSDLGEDDQGTYWVGMVARADVSMDEMAREVFARLTDDGSGTFAWPRDTQPLLREIASVVGARDDLSAEAKEAAAETFAMAIDAHDRRNRFIHDSLLPTGQGRWQQRRVPPKSQPRIPVTHVKLTDLRRCTVDLVACSWRLFGLLRILDDPAQLTRDPHDADPYDNLLMLRGQFDARDNGEISYSSRSGQQHVF